MSGAWNVGMWILGLAMVVYSVLRNLSAAKRADKQAKEFKRKTKV